MATPAVEFRGVTKCFAGVTALDGVSLAIEPGECHALVGENGAGKSTLGKILAGIHRPDAGAFYVAGRPCRFSSPAEASAAGVGMVHQELAFCPDLSVAENLSLGRCPRRGRLFVNRTAMYERAAAMLARIGVDLDVRRPIRGLSIAQQQLVQIASAVGSGARILIFDEPTSSLSHAEAQHLLELIDALRREGVTLIYVSHRMPEILRLADRATVLRDGRLVQTLARAELSEDRLVRLMVGRPLEEYFPRHLERPPGPVVLRVENLGSPAGFAGVSFEVRAGEIVGLAGLVGSGRSEVAQAIFGLDHRASGNVTVDGRAVRGRSVKHALRAGIGLTPEDRKRQGLILPLSARFNFSLRILDRLRRFGLLDRRRERSETSRYFERMRVVAPSPDAPVSVLSGGNQQKIVLARWLAVGGRVLIVDEPTRGVDVAAKAAIHALLDELAGQGLAIVLISSELPEVIHLSTRILVMRGGRMVGEVPRSEATQNRLLREMAGVGAAA